MKRVFWGIRITCINAIMVSFAYWGCDGSSRIVRKSRSGQIESRGSIEALSKYLCTSSADCRRKYLPDDLPKKDNAQLAACGCLYDCGPCCYSLAKSIGHSTRVLGKPSDEDENVRSVIMRKACELGYSAGCSALQRLTSGCFTQKQAAACFELSERQYPGETHESLLRLSCNMGHDPACDRLVQQTHGKEQVKWANMSCRYDFGVGCGVIAHELWKSQQIRGNKDIIFRYYGLISIDENRSKTSAEDPVFKWLVEQCNDIGFTNKYKKEICYWLIRPYIEGEGPTYIVNVVLEEGYCKRILEKHFKVKP